MEVERRAREQHAGQATEQKGDQETEREQHGCFEGELSFPHGADPVEELHPGGYRDEEAHQEKNGSRTAPVANMWCAHTAVDRAAMAMVA